MFGVREALMLLLAFLFYLGLIGAVVWFAVRILKAVESIAKNIEKIAEKDGKSTS
ncbi:MAG: hypothetical protein HYZ10_03310 [Ignavibacteriales bacterium]|nr:hypothetical protein [Ignavibacteriales bacterium]